MSDHASWFNKLSDHTKESLWSNEGSRLTDDDIDALVRASAPVTAPSWVNSGLEGHLELSEAAWDYAREQRPPQG
jgi:hypothetical protein